MSRRETAARVLGEWSAGLTLAGLPPEVRDTICLHALDGIGCALAAGNLGAAAPALTVARRFGGEPEARWIGSEEAVAAPAAAMASGVLIHALDFDDTHPGALVHPSAAVLPGALAVAEETGAGGAELLEALVVGYETVVRLGTAAEHGFHARGFHATSVCGVMATALVASRLYGLSTDATVDALGIAGSEAGGLLEFLHTGASTKQLHPGFAAQGGVTAARLAAAGASGPDSVLEGGYGLYEALAGREVGAEAVTCGLGERFLLMDTVVKPYPACHLFHAALDAALEAVGKLARDDGGTGVDPARIESVTVDVAPDAVPIVCEPAASKVRPRTAYEAKFSLPWSVAAMLIDGSVTLATYDDPGRRPEVAALAERISYRVVPFDGPVADAPQRVVTRTGGHEPELDTCSDPAHLGNRAGAPRAGHPEARRQPRGRRSDRRARRRCARARRAGEGVRGARPRRGSRPVSRTSLLTEEIAALVGTTATYTAPEELGRAAIRYFATAVGDDNPLYGDEGYARANGYDGVVAPPTLVCETNQYADNPRDEDGYAGHSWEIEVPGTRLVRGGNEYTFHRTVRPEDVITATWRIASVAERISSNGQPMLIVESVASYTNQGRELLATNSETLIFQALP